MRVGVVAELETVVSPHFQGIDAGIDFTGLVEFFFVHESHGGNLLVAQGCQKFRRHRVNFVAGHKIRRSGWEVIDGDGNGALWWTLSTQRRDRRKQ